MYYFEDFTNKLDLNWETLFYCMFCIHAGAILARKIKQGKVGRGRKAVAHTLAALTLHQLSLQRF